MLDRTDEAAKPPKTDRWSALEGEPHGEPIILVVSGIVEVGRTNMEPRLSEASDDGATLNLDLTIEATDHEGADVLVWKQANFSKQVGDNEYRDVHVRWDGEVIGHCTVIDDDQAHARLTLHTDAANLKARVKSVPGKAKKAVAKAKDVVETIGSAIGGRTGRVVGAAVVVAAGTAAVAGVASRMIGKKAKKKTGKKAAKSTAKTKSKAKSKTKAATKAKSKTKAKAKTKKTKSKKAAPKKSTKRATKKTRSAKKSRRVTKKRGTKK